MSEFIKTAEDHQVKTGEARISYPCKDYAHFIHHDDIEKIRYHLFKQGFTENYTWWKHHGEAPCDCNNAILESSVNNNDDNYGSSNQNINDMLHDAEHNAELDMEKLQQLFVESEKPLYKDTTLIDFDEDVIKNGPAAKVLWYLFIIPRLKQLYSNPKIEKLLRWHAEDQKIDRKIRHVADASQWKNIDNHYTNFGAEIRNIRFELSSDGINPFGNMRLHLLKEDIDLRSEAMKNGYYQWMARRPCRNLLILNRRYFGTLMILLFQ
ncbi:ulp1 protease family, C-terminal catalytic domain-containing protein [Tanacetum coccineum]|uniref:Ulp1 protease family, C-terminal catalytic domain-containing protein n=1 Tax=Tanacetum coccineum TaxID=301880 RepID=A0ABQ5I2A7_9ASTR